MKRRRLSLYLSTLTLLLAIAACVLPGQAAQPAPVTDPNGIETAIVGTSQAAAQQTEQAGMVVTPTTEIPLQVSPSPSPERVSSFGTSLVELADGSTQFRDYRAGVQMIFPPNWLPMRAGEPEYYEAWETYGSQSQWFLEEIGSIQTLDLDLFRVTAYDIHPEHIVNDMLPKINIVFLQGDTRTLKQVDADEKTMIRQSVKAGHKHISSDYQVTAGLDVLVFRSQWNTVPPVVYYTGMFFRVPNGLMIVDYYVVAEQQEPVSSEWKQIVESITVLTP